MKWFKEQSGLVNLIAIVTAFCASFLWLNGKFNDLEREMRTIEKDVAIVKAVLIMKNIMPMELAKSE